jgi:prevent-host-death family protein
MPVCVPIKELKNTATFAELVESSPEPVIVTRNGRSAFAVMTVEELDALRLEAARAELYRLVGEAEDDISAGRVISARESQAQARARYGL